jgi:nicotinate-nucleotide pyrophosphorylase (carboxylating)
MTSRVPDYLNSTTRRLIDLAIKEDFGSSGDVTTRFLLAPEKIYFGKILAKHAGVLCGSAVASEVFKQLCPKARITWLAKDRQKIQAGSVLARISGPRELLSAERIALNFLQRLSGIATLTKAYVDKIRGTQARIYDTRKTLPGWRALDKYAVRTGGGFNHRFGLYDMALVKDNHLAASRFAAYMGLRALRRKYPDLPVEIEAKNHGQVELAVSLGANLILLDNMPIATLKKEIRWLRATHPKIQVEVSGGIDLKNIRSIAQLGPDRISIGRLTHSAPALDISLEIIQK